MNKHCNENCPAYEIPLKNVWDVANFFNEMPYHTADFLCFDHRMSWKMVQHAKMYGMSGKKLSMVLLKGGRTTAATEVDHVVPLAAGGPDDETNFQSLCLDHHREKSARESRIRNGGGGARTLNGSFVDTRMGRMRTIFS